MIHTSYFAGLKKLPADLTPVAIARGVPPFYQGRRELRLAPTRDMLAMSSADFDAAFAAQLDALDLAEIVEGLGAGAVLLCWERPGQRCHRRLVAELLESELAIVVTELGFDRADVPAYHTLPSGLKKKRRTPPPSGQGLLF